MIFTQGSIEAGRGGILAHSLKTPEGVLRKGALLDDHACAALRAAGYATIAFARLEPGDIAEEEAAAALGDLLLGPGMRRSGVVNGRVNLFASCSGLLRIDPAKIARLNLADEAVALATLADYSLVRQDDMLATLKIIPFAISGRTLAQAEHLIAEGNAAMQVKPFRPLRVGLIATLLPQLKPATIAATVAATAARIAAHGGVLLPAVEVPHDAAPLSRAIGGRMAAGAELILISGASAVTDRLDTAPRAIVQAGGHITHFGMPVDPGNLICFGAIGAVPAIVLPGCARSPALNGIDWVLDRIFAGETLDDAALAAMGAGGLLKEAEARPTPRAAPAPTGFGKAPVSPPRIAALVLAAGKSSRMGGANKLLAALPDGGPMIAHTADHVLATTARPVIVVTGHQDREIRQALAGRPLRFLHAADYAQGLSASLKAGIAALSAEIGAALICLGDMPLIPPGLLQRLLEAFDPATGREIVIPVFDGQRGNPVLWGRRFFPEFQHLSGDAGARQIMHRFAEYIVEVPVESDAVLRDFDTPEMLAALNR